MRDTHTSWKRIIVSTVLALLTCGAQPAWAQSRAEKLKRGAANVLFGVAEIPSQLRSCPSHPDFILVVDKHPILKYPFCLAVGIIGASVREVLGLTEVMTFPVEWPWPLYQSPYESWWITDPYPWQ